MNLTRFFNLCGLDPRRSLRLATLLGLGLAVTAHAFTLPPTATVPKNALRFLGANQYVEVPAAAELNLTTQFTVEAWVNISSFGPNYMAIVTKGDDWGLVRNNNTSKISFRTKSGNTFHDLVSTINLVAGRWYHIAAVYNGTSKLLYLDGVLDGSAAYSSPVNINALSLQFGANAAAPNKFFNGQMDNIRLWSVARNLTQIKADLDRHLFGDDAGLLGEWRFNEPDGTVAEDSSTAHRSGTLLNMVAADRVNGLDFRSPPPRATLARQALRFTGDDRQFVEVENRYETDFDLAGTTLTLEAWINIAAFDLPWQTIVTKGEAWGLTRNNATTKLAFRTKNGATVHDLVTTSDFLLNRWYHVAAVFTGTEKRIYVDGVLDATAAYTTPLPANNVPVVIGANGETAGRGWHGDLESVRIWSVARTAAELNSEMLRDLRGSETGLLGDWRFNEGTGPAAFDSSYGERDTALVGLTEYSRVAGIGFAPAPPPASVGTSGALKFTGVTGSVEPRVVIGSEDQFDIAQQLTLEAWIYVEAFNRPWQTIISKGEAWSLVRYGESSRLAFRNQQGLGFHELASVTSLQLNRWYHVAAVFDGQEKRLYLDGALDASAPLATPFEVNNHPVVIGANAAQPLRAFKGRIEAVRIWSIPRGGAQILDNFDRDLRGSEVGLKGEWRFNEASGLTATDTSKRHIDGVLKDMALPGDRVGGLLFRPPSDGELAVAFDQAGSLKQYITLPDESRFDFSNQFTAEAWVYVDALPAATVALISKGSSAWEVRLRASGKIQFSTAGLTDSQVTPVTDLVSAGALPTKEWTHVAVTWNSATGAKAIYLNGAFDQAHSGITGILGQNNLAVRFAVESLASGTGSEFMGILDEVRLWSSARSEDRIREGHSRRLAGNEPQLAGVWSFDEGAGTTVFDGRDGSTTHGTFASGMTVLNRVEGQPMGEPLPAQFALTFNGVDEYVQVTDSAALIFTGKATFEAWIKPMGSGWRTILSKGSAAYGLAVDDQNRLRFFINGSYTDALASDGHLENGVWQHVAVVVNDAPAGTMFYINGKIAGSSTTAILANQAGPLWLGRRSATGPGDYFNGQMDEVRLWSTARSDGEIEFLSVRSPAPKTIGLREYWGFNEAMGTVLHDLTDTRADGTLVNLDNSNWGDGQFWGAGSVDPSLVLQTDPGSRGLWIGNVTLSRVNEVGQALNGAAETATPTADTASVRVLLHVDAAGRARLLKDVIVMQTLTNPQDPASEKRVVLVSDASRITLFKGIVERAGKPVGVRHGTVAFDFDGFDLPLIGGVGPGVGCAGTISLAKDAATNPFRHRYHSDHREGYDIGRQFSLQFDGAPGDVLTEAPNYGVQRLTGIYKETITGLHKIALKVEGTVTLDRISNVAVLNDGQF